jgi:hypothetical protein
MSAEHVYAWLLLLYPQAFREEFALEMLADFSRLRESRRDRQLAFWRFVIADVVRSAMHQHVERLRDSRGGIILRWLFVCLVGIATTGLVVDLFGSTFSYLYHPFLEGLDIRAVGITQSIVLRHRLRLALAWMLVSGAAAAAGLLVIASFAMIRQPLGFVESGVVLGGTVGVAQWMLVRLQDGYDRRWAFATVFVLATAAVTFGAAIQSTFAGVNPLAIAPLVTTARPYRDLLDIVIGTLQQIRTWTVIAVAFIAMTTAGVVIGSLALKPIGERHAH